MFGLPILLVGRALVCYTSCGVGFFIIHEVCCSFAAAHPLSEELVFPPAFKAFGPCLAVLPCPGQSPCYSLFLLGSLLILEVMGGPA